MADKKADPGCLTPLSQHFFRKRPVRSVSRVTRIKPSSPALFKFRRFIGKPQHGVAPKAFKRLSSSQFLHKITDSSPTLATLQNRHYELFHGLTRLTEVLSQAEHPHAATLQQITQFYHDTITASTYAEVPAGVSSSLKLQRQLLQQLNALTSAKPTPISV